MSSGKKNVPAAVPEGEIETWDAQNTEGKKGTETQVSIRFFLLRPMSLLRCLLLLLLKKPTKEISHVRRAARLATEKKKCKTENNKKKVKLNVIVVEPSVRTISELVFSCALIPAKLKRNKGARNWKKKIEFLHSVVSTRASYITLRVLWKFFFCCCLKFVCAGRHTRNE